MCEGDEIAAKASQFCVLDDIKVKAKIYRDERGVYVGACSNKVSAAAMLRCTSRSAHQRPHKVALTPDKARRTKSRSRVAPFSSRVAVKENPSSFLPNTTKHGTHEISAIIR